jgi:hypothetical protein
VTRVHLVPSQQFDPAPVQDPHIGIHWEGGGVSRPKGAGEREGEGGTQIGFTQIVSPFRVGLPVDIFKIKKRL